MKKLTRSQFLQLSIMLFGLFFGAGNLIFPPLLGNKAGSATFISLIAFCVTAVLFPVLGAIVVGKTNGLSNLAKRVGPVFSVVFTTAIYLSIGPGLGIPRAGSVPFEMAIAPYVPETLNLNIVRFVYTLVFFTIALLICLKPNKLVERVGKFLTPTLLLMILFMFVRIVMMDKNIAAPSGDYLKAPVTKGFLAGYETMDAVAALNFGFVIAQAIKRFGVEDENEVTRYEIKAGLLAGSVLFLVYAMLASIGMIGSQKFAGAENGAQVLSGSIKLVLGDFGLVLLAFIFTLACLTTCVGLITSGGEYFEKLFNNKLSYRAWVYIWTLFSFVMANFGLNKLLAFSVPLLQIIYPVALVLIVMGISHKYLNYSKVSYVSSAVVSVGLPLVEVLDKTFHIKFGFVTNFVKSLALYEEGLAWLLPTIFVLVLTSLVVKVMESFIEVDKIRQKY
ncbi:branched-chain amino acid transport system II carrier protein [Anaerococcus vaginimassiliensis]|uniref:branched-chain amino acid transport system II carrier protein n=1 Tax=Anaerococcus vaginimassiliensis TaxID=2042308 RepID=UPI0010309542|nr:branched-chain amino acid transport system II carrier protein [Anaerococcus vaginimassiliensis]